MVDWVVKINLLPKTIFWLPKFYRKEKSKIKEIITYEELRKITSQAWLSVNDIMKITSTSKRAAYKIKNTIKEYLLKKGYYIPNVLLPTREVLEYLKIKEK